MKKRIFFIIFLMFGLQNFAYADLPACPTSPTKTYTSCNDGYYLDVNLCKSCTGVSFTDSQMMSGGAKSRTCYRTGGAGGTGGPDSCTGSGNCGSWTYDCFMGYYLDEPWCRSCSGAQISVGDWETITNGERREVCTGTGAGGGGDIDSCTTECTWEYNCDNGCYEANGACVCDEPPVTCDDGEYYDDGECKPCSDATFFTTDNTTPENGYRDGYCHYAASGAGGTSPKTSCDPAYDNCDWTYHCNSGYTLDGTTCVSNSGGGGDEDCETAYYYEDGSCHACIDETFTDTRDITDGTKWRECHYSGGTGGGGAGVGTCTRIYTDCTGWTCNCDYGDSIVSGDDCSCPSDSGGGGGGNNCGDKPSGSSVTDCKQQGYSGWNSSTTCCTGTAGSCDYCTDSDDCSGSQVCLANCCKTISCRTCTSNSDCSSLQTCNLSTGCCVFSGGGGDTTTCTERTCTSNDNCNFGETCVNGYCYGNGIVATSCNKLTCDTGTSCQETLTSGTYACLPDCGTGAYFVGATATCSCRSCPIMDDAWDGDNSLLAGTTASAGYGAGGITSCYIPAGTYYDDNGTFVFDADCPYTASDTGGDSGTTECASNADCALLYGSHYICVSGSCVLKLKI